MTQISKYESDLRTLSVDFFIGRSKIRPYLSLYLRSNWPTDPEGVLWVAPS